MKKIALVLLLATALTTFAACSGNDPAETTAASETTTTADAATTTTAAPEDNTTPNNPGTSTNIEHNVKLNQDLTTLKTVIEKSDPANEEYEGYSVVTSGAEWQINSGIDYSLYDFLGTGSDLLAYIEDEDNTSYSRYVQEDKLAYYRVRYENGEFVYKKVARNAISQTKALGAKIQVNSKLGRLVVYYQEIELRASLDYTEVTGNSGAFLRFKFHTNLPATYKVNISTNKNDTGDGIIVCNNIVPRKSDDGSYVGAGQMTIPYDRSGEYYVNVISGGKCLGSATIKINEVEDSRNPNLHLQLTGDWDAITAPGYMESLINLFYNTYPRLYQRWGNGDEPRTITFVSDPTYDGVAYCMGTFVVVSTAYANSNPSDIGFFSHEITHSVQQFNFYYGDGAWFTENMANYGGFRYHHWSDGKYVQLYQDANQNDLYNWNWGAYGDGSKWFFAYVDYKWPTKLDANGNKIRGLLDTLVYEIKNGRLKGAGSDSATDKNNMFNKIVKEVTGLDCMEDVRKQYEADFKSGAWDFKGFGEYSDNFLTENVPYVNNPNYPMVTDKNPGNKTATALATAVTEGDNLALGATVYKVSGATKTAEGAEKLVDGNLGTKWCSTSSTVKDKTYSLDGTRQWVILDLGEKKTFNTYTIYNTRTKETYGNMTEWEILVSNDGTNWTSVDYQASCNQDLVSFNVGSQSARYVMIKGYTVDTGVGTVRLYEFQLYNQ
ncbi:MAG: discoidin domain-containing protein [Clostridia bacterium]|nr:discoidin domain-containing protein [Clostridia bacterium]